MHSLCWFPMINTFVQRLDVKFQPAVYAISGRLLCDDFVLEDPKGFGASGQTHNRLK